MLGDVSVYVQPAHWSLSEVSHKEDIWGGVGEKGGGSVPLGRLDHGLCVGLQGKFPYFENF